MHMFHVLLSGIAERAASHQLEVEALKSIYAQDMTMTENAWTAGQHGKGKGHAQEHAHETSPSSD